MVKLLIEKGIDVDRIDRDDCDVLYRLNFYKDPDKDEEIIQLIEASSNFN